MLLGGAILGLLKRSSHPTSGPRTQKCQLPLLQPLIPGQGLETPPQVPALIHIFKSA